MPEQNNAEMRMTLECSTLVSMAERAAKIAMTKSAVPILSTVLIEVDAEGVVSMTATDLDKKIVTKGMASDVEQPGATVVNAAMLARLSGSLPPSASVEMTADDYSLKLAAGRTEVSLRTTPAEDYPEIAIRGDDDIAFDIASKDLTRIIKKSVLFVSREVMRHCISGVYLHVEGENLRCVGADGRQLCVSSIPLPPGAAEMPGVIVPAEACAQIVKGCEKFETVRLAVSDRSVSIETPTTQIACKVVDAKFPRYQNLIANMETYATVPVQEAREAVSRASLVAGDTSILLSFEHDMLMITSSGESVGRSSDEISCSYGAESNARAFDPKFIATALSVITSDDVDMYVEGLGDDAIQIRSAADPDDVVVIMPRRR